MVLLGWAGGLWWSVLVARPPFSFLDVGSILFDVLADQGFYVTLFVCNPFELRQYVTVCFDVQFDFHALNILRSVSVLWRFVPVFDLLPGH